MSVAKEPFPLKKPIEVELKRAGADVRTETFTELEFHEFRARDLRSLDGLAENAHGSQILALMARMVRQPVQVVDDLGFEDFQALAEKVKAFLPDGLTTGATG